MFFSLRSEGSFSFLLRRLTKAFQIITIYLSLIPCVHSLESLSMIDGTRLSHLTFHSVIGSEHSLTPHTGSITQENLRNILNGVEFENIQSLYFFGILKLYGISVPKDEQVAANSFKRAGELGHPEAATALGTMLMNGMGVQKDYSAAVAAFRMGIALEDQNALWLLGKLLLEGPAPTMNGSSAPFEASDDEKAEAFYLFHVAASNHIPQAEHLLATMYEYGMGVEQDFPTAMQYYQRAAEQKYIESMYHLSLMYSYGRGCPQDYKRAFSLLELAARENHAPSSYYLGVFKMYGYGCEPNYEQAFNWFEVARGLDDFRISAKAEESARELKLLMDEANLENERTLNLFQQQSTS